MKYKIWDIKKRYPTDVIKSILQNRGVEDAESFFNPDYKLLQKPLNFPSMKQALSRIRQAKDKGEKVGIFMDYDADGICGGAIIYHALKSDFKSLVWYVPKRSEGYGLTKKAVDYFVSQKISLLLTVDCGVKNIKEIDHGAKQGIETIVFDHHQLGDKVSDKAILVHPLYNKSNKLKFRSYSGGGVAFMFAKAYLHGSGQEKWLLDLAAISTVADMVLLQGDNRIIVKFGQKVIARSRNVGLNSLLKVAQIKKENVSAYDIGFLIAPRINAAGRMDDPRKSFELLICENEKKADELASQINEHNRIRQEELEAAQKRAINQVKKSLLDKNKIIVLKNKSWNEGILGLIAGRIDEYFYRPTIVLKDEDLMRGSARSVPGVDITKLLKEVSHHLESYGGHNQAAGLSLKKAHFEKFYKSIVLKAQKIDDKLLEKKLSIDALIGFEQINFDLAKDLQKMDPFGYGNKTPIFACENLKIASCKAVGQDLGHLKIEVCKDGKYNSCIIFNATKNAIVLENGDIVDIAFNLKINEYNQRQKLDLVVEDVKKRS